MKENKNFINLPNFLKPAFKTNLVRIGKKNDGGYCIPETSLKNTTILYSFGLGDDWSFEKNFKESSNSKIICIDHSVTLGFWFKRFIKTLVEIIGLQKNLKENVKKLFTFFNYKFFFNNSEKIHITNFFGTVGDKMSDIKNTNIIDMTKILKQWNNKNFFIKIDIEGNEYRILNQILQNQKELTGLVIEFHNCDLMFDKIKLFIESLSLDLVHIHVNNFGFITKDRFPTVLELTFSPREYNLKKEYEENIFPDPILDQPNNKNEEDINIIFN